ncbi:MAG: hypothetical protein ACI9CV_000344 [Ilumatobacter sp.]|jgi:hypothetical protein
MREELGDNVLFGGVNFIVAIVERTGVLNELSLKNEVIELLMAEPAHGRR